MRAVWGVPQVTKGDCRERIAKVSDNSMSLIAWSIVWLGSNAGRESRCSGQSEGMLSLSDMTVTLPIKERSSENNKTNQKESIPAVVYGPKQTPVSVVVNRKEFEKLFKVAGESTVIELTGLKSPISSLVKEVTFSPLQGGIIHVDFYALESGKEIETHVPLSFVNESPAVKLGAVVNKVMQEVMVTCQPADLPAHIDVDLSLLTTVESQIHISDIVVPKGVVIKEDGKNVVAIVEMITEEVEAAPVMDIADIPVEKKGKEEEAAAA